MTIQQQKRSCKLAILTALLVGSLGCQNGMFKLEPLTAGSGSTVTSAELQELRNRIQKLDNDNQSLQAQLAQERQRYRIASDEVELLREQLQQQSDMP
ncbi:MAG: hypothetical protein ACJZ8O_12705 [Pirellulaceae bacterium]